MHTLFYRILAVWVCLQSVLAQDYLSYHHLNNRINRDIFEDNLGLALLRFDTINENYDFIFSNHCLKALKVSVLKNDSLRASLWLERAIKSGIELSQLSSDEITSRALQYSTCRNYVSAYDSLHSIYDSKVNWEIRLIIDSLFTADQTFTSKTNSKNVKNINEHYQRHATLLIEITKKYGYPGEKLIGVDNLDNHHYLKFLVVNAKHMIFMSRGLSKSKVFTMLMHYYSTHQTNENDLFLENVKNGYMFPYEYAIINDLMCLYGIKGCGDFLRYYEWGFFPRRGVSQIEIDERRSAIGLEPFEYRAVYNLVNDFNGQVGSHSEIRLD